MKRFLTYIALILNLFALQSCNNEENLSSEPKLSNVAIGLTSEIVGSRANNNLQGTSLDPSTEIGVYVLKSDGVMDYGYPNVYCTHESTISGTDSLVQSTQMYFPLANHSVDVDIRAYAPFESSYARLQSYTFSVQTDQSTSEGYIKSDLMYGIPKNGNPVHHVISHDPAQKVQNVPLLFNHLLSKLTLILQPVAPLSTEAVVGAQVFLKEVDTQVSFNLVDGTIGETTEPNDILLGDIVSVTNLSVSALVPPQIVAGNSKLFEVRLVNGDVYRYDLPENTSLTLDGGKHYQFRMKFGASLSEVTMSIADWVGVAGEYVF